MISEKVWRYAIPFNLQNNAAFPRRKSGHDSLEKEVIIVNEKRDHSFYSVEKLASATECTGLMPAMPPTMDGQEELADLMAIHCPPGANGSGTIRVWQVLRMPKSLTSTSWAAAHCSPAAW